MSMIQNVKVIENKQIAPDIFDLRIYSPEQAAKALAGQFLGIYTGSAAMLLPRPLSICEIDASGGILRVIYRVVGDGTRDIAGVAPGGELRVLGPLGNGYDLKNLTTENTEAHGRVAIVGGGLGVPPLLGLAAGVRGVLPDAKITVYLGFRDKSQAILVEDFGGFVDEVVVCTDDGSYGVKGNVIEAMTGGIPGQARNDDIIYGCGPYPMLKALAEYAKQSKLPCFVSVEEHMACCVGTCLACAVKVQTDSGAVNKRACYDGPVFDASEVVWE